MAFLTVRGGFETSIFGCFFFFPFVGNPEENIGISRFLVGCFDSKVLEKSLRFVKGCLGFGNEREIRVLL